MYRNAQQIVRQLQRLAREASCRFAELQLRDQPREYWAEVARQASRRLALLLVEAPLDRTKAWSAPRLAEARRGVAWTATRLQGRLAYSRITRSRITYMGLAAAVGLVLAASTTFALVDQDVLPGTELEGAIAQADAAQGELPLPGPAEDRVPASVVSQNQDAPAASAPAAPVPPAPGDASPSDVAPTTPAAPMPPVDPGIVSEAPPLLVCDLPPAYYQTTLLVEDPKRPGCCVEVPVCLPGCCVEPPQVSCCRGLIRRSVTYCWPCCGCRVKVVFGMFGRVRVQYC